MPCVSTSNLVVGADVEEAATSAGVSKSIARAFSSISDSTITSSVPVSFLINTAKKSRVLLKTLPSNEPYRQKIAQYH